jgi:hypothetical protein
MENEKLASGYPPASGINVKMSVSKWAFCSCLWLDLTAIAIAYNMKHPNMSFPKPTQNVFYFLLFFFFHFCVR